MSTPPPDDVQYLDLADYLWLAGAALDRAPEAIFDVADLGLAESALHTPAATYGGVEFYPDLVTKARVLLVHLAEPTVALRPDELPESLEITMANDHRRSQSPDHRGIEHDRGRSMAPWSGQPAFPSPPTPTAERARPHRRHRPRPGAALVVSSQPPRHGPGSEEEWMGVRFGVPGPHPTALTASPPATCTTATCRNTGTKT
jgi:hypothetical protein